MTNTKSSFTAGQWIQRDRSDSDGEIRKTKFTHTYTQQRSRAKYNNYLTFLLADSCQHGAQVRSHRLLSAQSAGQVTQTVEMQ